MDTNKHLTQNQLLDFAAGTLEKGKKTEIGSHLLGCDACRNLLPLPTPQRLFAILTGEDELEENKSKDKSFFQTLFSWVKATFRKPPVLVWSFGSLVLILGFFVFVWFAIISGKINEDEMARGFDSEILKVKQTKINIQSPPPSKNISDNEKHIFSSNSNRDVADTKPIVLKTNSFEKKRESKIPEKKSQPKRIVLVKENEKENISLTRGGLEKCGKENPVEMEFVSNSGAITFRWKKVKNAIKYHLYISDDDEILIDEYETVQDTFYVLEKKLDETKTYQWKVIITLENGKTASGASQKFTIKDVRQNQKKLVGKKKSEIRCSENK